MTTSAPPTSRLEAAHTFLHALYGDGEGATGQRVLWRLDDRKSQRWPANQIDAFAVAAIKAAATTDVFFGIALQDQDAALEEKRREERLDAAKDGRSPKPVTLDGPVPTSVSGSAK